MLNFLHFSRRIPLEDTHIHHFRHSCYVRETRKKMNLDVMPFVVEAAAGKVYGTLIEKPDRHTEANDSR